MSNLVKTIFEQPQTNNNLSLDSSMTESKHTEGARSVLFKLVSFKNGQKEILRTIPGTLDDTELKSHEDDSMSNEKPLNNGRWTKEECQRFEEGLKKFGRNWKKVEAFVGTRSGTQIRSHAQKYFLKHKGKLETQECEQSVAPSLFNGATLDQKTEPQNYLSVTGTCVEQNTQKPKDDNETPKHQSNDIKIIAPNSYLLTHMKTFGFNSVEDIYASYTKLSDWVNTSTQSIPARMKKSIGFPLFYRIC